MQKTIEIISLLGAVQGLLLSILLVTRRVKSEANIYLALYLLLIVGDCLEPFFLGAAPKVLLLLWGGVIFLHGPLFYLYIRSVVVGDARGYKPCLLLPVIYLIVVVVGSIIPFSLEIEKNIEVVLTELFFAHLIIFGYMSLRVVRSGGGAIRQHKKALHTPWLQFIVSFVLVLYSIAWISHVAKALFHWSTVAEFDFLIQLLLAVVVYIISWQAIAKPDAFRHVEEREQVLEKKEKYLGSLLSAEKMSAIEGKLLTTMNERKLFLNPELSLEELSSHIGENRYHVSQVLNSKCNTNFNDFVNQYRVQEFKRLALAPTKRKKSLYILSKQAGFNSRTTFNTIFKKHTGRTPGTFVKEHLNRSENSEMTAH